MINPLVEPLRVEDDGMGRTVVDVHQIIRDLAGNILKDQIVQHVYSIHNDLIKIMEIRKLDTKQAS